MSHYNNKFSLKEENLENMSIIWKPLPPFMYLDSLLISWGLLSGKHSNNGYILSTKWGRIHQIIAMLVNWCIFFKCIFFIIIPDDSDLIWFIGDINAIFMQMSPRIFFLLFYVVCSLKPALITTYYYLINFSDYFVWLELTEMIKGMAFHCNYLVILKKTVYHIKINPFY